MAWNTFHEFVVFSLGTLMPMLATRFVGKRRLGLTFSVLRVETGW